MSSGELDSNRPMTRAVPISESLIDSTHGSRGFPGNWLRIKSRLKRILGYWFNLTHDSSEKHLILSRLMTQLWTEPMSAYRFAMWIWIVLILDLSSPQLQCTILWGVIWRSSCIIRDVLLQYSLLRSFLHFARRCTPSQDTNLPTYTWNSNKRPRLELSTFLVLGFMIRKRQNLTFDLTLSLELRSILNS